MEHPEYALLSPQVVLHLPRTIIESGKEPWVDLFGKLCRDESGSPYYLVESAFNNGSAKRRKKFVEIKSKTEQRKLGYDEAIRAAARDNSAGDYADKIGEAHAHPQSTCLPGLSECDTPSIKDSMVKGGLDSWLEIILHHKRADTKECQKKFGREAYSISTYADGRPGRIIYNNRRWREMGIEAVFYGFYVFSENGAVSAREIPLKFHERTMVYAKPMDVVLKSIA